MPGPLWSHVAAVQQTYQIRIIRFKRQKLQQQVFHHSKKPSSSKRLQKFFLQNFERNCLDTNQIVHSFFGSKMNGTNHQAPKTLEKLVKVSLFLQYLPMDAANQLAAYMKALKNKKCRVFRGGGAAQWLHSCPFSSGPGFDFRHSPKGS